jgi:curved DNA-binding protein CbpA
VTNQLDAPAKPVTDYYHVMRLHPDADAVMVDQSYWHLARVYGAAIPTDPSAKDKLDHLNEAYGVLRSPELRRQYDQERDALVGAGVPPLPPQPEPQPPRAAETAMERLAPGPDSESPPPRQGVTARLWRPSRPRLSFRWPNIPHWKSAAGAFIILAMAPAAFVVNQQAALLIALLLIALVVTALRLLRRPPRRPRLSSSHLPAGRGPRFPARPLGAGPDADTLRQSTKAMLERWQKAAGEVSTSQSAASPPHHEPLLVHPHDRS